MDKSTGTGAANDAGVATQPNLTVVGDPDAETRETNLKDAAARVEGCKARVVKAKDALAGAEKALAQAIAEQEAI